MGGIGNPWTKTYVLGGAQGGRRSSSPTCPTPPGRRGTARRRKRRAGGAAGREKWPEIARGSPAVVRDHPRDSLRAAHSGARTDVSAGDATWSMSTRTRSRIPAPGLAPEAQGSARVRARDTPARTAGAAGARRPPRRAWTPLSVLGCPFFIFPCLYIGRAARRARFLRGERSRSTGSCGRGRPSGSGERREATIAALRGRGCRNAVFGRMRWRELRHA